MLPDITVADVESRLPRYLTPPEKQLAEVYIEDAIVLIASEFSRRKKDFYTWAENKDNHPIIRLVVVNMVAAPILVGISRGLKSASSSTAHQSDSGTWDNPSDISWGGVAITDEHIRMLGLSTGAKLRFRFPRPLGGAEVIIRERNY